MPVTYMNSSCNYLCLQTRKNKDKLEWDIHFWLGAKTTQVSTHIKCKVHSISGSTELRDMTPVFPRKVDFMRWFPITIPMDFVANHAAFNLKAL